MTTLIPRFSFVGRLTLVAALAGSIAVAGCGSSDSKSDSQQITESVSAYATAFADGNGKLACQRFTERAKQEVIAQSKSLGGDFNTCQEAIKQIASIISSADKKDLRAIKVSKITITGNSATLQAGADNSATTRMSKVDGKWLFDGTVSEAN